MHTAVFEPDVRSVILKEAPVFYASMVMNRLYAGPTSCMVAGALTKYDLPELIGCLALRKVALIDPKDQKQESPAENFLKAGTAVSFVGL